MIPPKSIINSFLFFDGALEFSLAESNRFVIAHTNKYVIYEFWDCVMKEPKKIGDMSKFLFSATEPNIFYILQENWPKYNDPYLRSAMFFLLNRCSEDGHVSAGNFVPQNYNSFALTRLNNFQVNNFHIKWDKAEDFLKGIENERKADFTLLPVGKFSYNFFEHGKSRGFEMTGVHHKKLLEFLRAREDKWIVVYKAHAQLYKLYKDYNITMLNKYGKTITDRGECEEVVIANF
jgi:site-specific DNA-adenine methylase|tara:strand:- start:18 stop:719 length:702 start_codon:yes stop_codon:yes gene_type:complete